MIKRHYFMSAVIIEGGQVVSYQSIDFYTISWRAKPIDSLWKQGIGYHGKSSWYSV